MSFSVLGSHPGHCITYHHYVFLGPSWRWQFLVLGLIFMTLTVLRSVVQLLCKNPSTEIFLMLFSCLVWGFEFGEIRPQRQNAILSLFVKGMYYQRAVTYHKFWALSHISDMTMCKSLNPTYTPSSTAQSWVHHHSTVRWIKTHCHFCTWKEVHTRTG